jgi:hypothetical protein
MKDKERRRLMGEEDVEDHKLTVVKRHRVVMPGEVQINDEDFEDMISLHSGDAAQSLGSSMSQDSSIQEVHTKLVRRRGRPRKDEAARITSSLQAQSAIAHTISSSSVHNNGVSSNENSVIDDDDDYTGFDDFSLEERNQIGKNFQKKLNKAGQR